MWAWKRHTERKIYTLLKQIWLYKIGLGFPNQFTNWILNFGSMCSLCTQRARALTLIVNSRVSFYRTLTYEQVSVMEAASMLQLRLLQKKIMNNFLQSNMIEPTCYKRQTLPYLLNSWCALQGMHQMNKKYVKGTYINDVRRFLSFFDCPISTHALIFWCPILTLKPPPHCCRSYYGEVYILIFHHNSNLLKLGFMVLFICNKHVINLRMNIWPSQVYLS